MKKGVSLTPFTCARKHLTFELSDSADGLQYGTCSGRKGRNQGTSDAGHAHVGVAWTVAVHGGCDVCGASGFRTS